MGFSKYQPGGIDNIPLVLHPLMSFGLPINFIDDRVDKEYARHMTQNNFSLSDFANGAKKNLESVALFAADTGLKVLTPERVAKIDNLKIADKVRGVVDKSADSLRVSVAQAKLKAAQQEADDAKAAQEAKSSQKDKPSI